MTLVWVRKRAVRYHKCGFIVLHCLKDVELDSSCRGRTSTQNGDILPICSNFNQNRSGGCKLNLSVSVFLSVREQGDVLQDKSLHFQ